MGQLVDFVMLSRPAAPPGCIVASELDERGRHESVTRRFLFYPGPCASRAGLAVDNSALAAMMLTKLRNSISNASRPARIVLVALVSWVLVLGTGITFYSLKAGMVQYDISAHITQMTL